LHTIKDQSDRFFPIDVGSDTKALLDVLAASSEKQLSTNELWRRTSVRRGGMGKNAFYKRLDIAINKGLVTQHKKRNRILYKLETSKYLMVVCGDDEGKELEDEELEMGIQRHINSVLRHGRRFDERTLPDEVTDEIQSVTPMTARVEQGYHIHKPTGGGCITYTDTGYEIVFKHENYMTREHFCI